MTAEEVGWLRILIESYAAEHPPEGDEDPSATAEMLGACRAVLTELEAAHPPCSRCRFGEAPVPGGLCPGCVEPARERDEVMPF